MICPNCKGAWLQQTDNPYVFVCLDCKGEFRLVGETSNLITVDMRKVNKLAKEINDFIFRVKEDMIVAEVMLSLTAIPIIQYREREEEEKEQNAGADSR
jgi:uncharacterized protein YbaR (Trm112 family)